MPSAASSAPARPRAIAVTSARPIRIARRPCFWFDAAIVGAICVGCGAHDSRCSPQAVCHGALGEPGDAFCGRSRWVGWSRTDWMMAIVETSDGRSRS